MTGFPGLDFVMSSTTPPSWVRQPVLPFRGVGLAPVLGSGWMTAALLRAIRFGPLGPIIEHEQVLEKKGVPEKGGYKK